ncbi:restriction endonuclease subunit S [Lactobacillus crispatus]|uniref:restriction endonuclease subunit S n=1 Tax=Lactobacillus crispatus TaxID=47770 RepID=UPI0012384079|nr:restriction endonuclease subunit S [Lactobacillus crispatus]KAA8807363.1 restriction endonuclease subunit S [Lactobacillus crispatus]
MEYMKLGDIVNIRTGKLNANVADEKGSYPFFTCSKKISSISSYSYDTEAVLVAGNGDLNVKYYKGKFDAYQRTYIITDNSSNQLYMPFLYFYMSAYVAQLRNQAIGGVIKYIKLQNLTEAEIRLPSIEQQKEIVKFLQIIQGVINDKKNEMSKLDELIKARFVEMFGDPINNSKNWKLINIKKCCVDILGGGTPSKSHPEFFTGSVPWVTPKDMKENVITDSKDHITYEAISNSSAKLIPSNSVLMVIRSGILKHTLPVAINKNEVTINQDMKAFVPTSEISPIFLENYFIAISPDILSKVRSVTADNINFKSFQKRKIILPPISLQNEFANFVQQVDKSKVAVQKSLDETQTLFDSLMQKYFR